MQRMIDNASHHASPATARYAVEKPLGSPEIAWDAKRGRNITGRRRRYALLPLVTHAEIQRLNDRPSRKDTQ